MSDISLPNSDVLATDWVASPGPELYSALADDSDLTYVSANISASPQLICGLDSPVTAGTVPVPIRIHVSSGSITARVSLLDDSNNVLGSSAWFTVTVNTPTTVTPTVVIASTATRIKYETGDAESGIVTEDGTFLVTEDGTYIVWTTGPDYLVTETGDYIVWK